MSAPSIIEQIEEFAASIGASEQDLQDFAAAYVPSVPERKTGLGLYLVSTGDFDVPPRISTQEMCVILVDRPDHPAIQEAREFVASINKRDVDEIVVNTVGFPQ